MTLKTILVLALAAAVLPGQAHGQGKAETKTTVCDNLLRTGQMDAAQQCYLQALESDPSNATINLRVCQILEAQGRVDKMEPYLSRVDKSSPEGADFLQMLELSYGTLNIGCRGNTGCPFFFLGRAAIAFTPPEDLEPSKAARLEVINRGLKDGRLWFQKENSEKASAAIAYFPVVTGAPLPYEARVSERTESFDFNFVARADLELTPADFDSLFCGVPDTMVELRVEIDDPEFEATFRPVAGSAQLLSGEGRFYASRGGTSMLEYERKGRPGINKKYLVVTSAVLTTAMLLLQR